MKILFIMYDNMSSRNHMPLGPCYVAAYAREHGYDDITYYSQDVYHYPDEHLTGYLDTHHFDVAAIGFVAGYYQFKKIKSICWAINNSKDRPYIVLGGHGPSPEPEFFIKAMGADAAVMGEGEVPFLNLLYALDKRTGLENVKGIAYKDAEKVIVNERQEPIRNLDSIPFPYYEALPIESYVKMDFSGKGPCERILYMDTSRGCNYHCNFCFRLENGIRFRSPQSIVEEIKKYKRDYNASFFFFVDELFMFNKKRVFELTEAFIKSNLNIRYLCNGRVNIATCEIVEMMKKSGCAYINYGIEQFDNCSLKAMNKQQTEEDIIRAIECTQKHGISIGFNIIFGNLKDTRNSLRRSLDLLKKYNDYCQLRVIRPVTPYPGSPLYYYAIEKGLLKGPADFYEKHKNLELPTVNFTAIPDDEFLRLMMEANKEIISDYYAHMKEQAVKSFEKVYFENDFDFRGARHS